MKTRTMIRTLISRLRAGIFLQRSPLCVTGTGKK
jgi:hypothetical protein